MARSTEEFIAWWRKREPRERTALALLSAFFCGLLLYFAVWQPAAVFRDAAEKSRDRHLAVLQYMKGTEQAARAAAGAGKTAAVSGQSLLTEVSRLAQEVGIKPDRLQPEGDEGVSIWFDNVPFDPLFDMLVRMETRQGIVVQQISIDRQDQPGLVRVRLIVRG